MIKPPLDVNAAARLSGSFELSDIVCVGLEAKYLSSEPFKELSLGFDTPPIQAVWELEGEGAERILKVMLPFALFIQGREEGRDVERHLATITVLMRLEYQVKVEPDEADVPHYTVIAYLHAWPYFRAEVHQLSSKLGFPPLVLPVIVSGHAASQITAVRLRDMKSPLPLPRRKPSKKKARETKTRAE